MERSNSESSSEDGNMITITLLPGPLDSRPRILRFRPGRSSDRWQRTLVLRPSSLNEETNDTMEAIQLMEVEAERHAPPLHEGAINEVSDNQLSATASSTDVERNGAMEPISLEAVVVEENERPLHEGAISEPWHSPATASWFTGIRLGSSEIRRCICTYPPFAINRCRVPAYLPSILWILLSAMLLGIAYLLSCYYYNSFTFHQDYDIESFHTEIDKLYVEGLLSSPSSRVCPTMLEVNGILSRNHSGSTLDTTVPVKHQTGALVGMILTIMIWAMSLGLCLIAQRK